MCLGFRVRVRVINILYSFLWKSEVGKKVNLGCDIKLILGCDIKLSWGFHVLSVLTIIGTLLLALSLGLQGIVTNFAAGILIAAQHQYHIGDVIETNAASASPTLGGGVMGSMTRVVKRFDLFHTELMDINTHVLHKIRNADLYAGIITNYRHGFFQSDNELVK